MAQSISEYMMQALQNRKAIMAQEQQNNLTNPTLQDPGGLNVTNQPIVAPEYQGWLAKAGANLSNPQPQIGQAAPVPLAGQTAQQPNYSSSHSPSNDATGGGNSYSDGAASGTGPYGSTGPSGDAGGKAGGAVGKLAGSFLGPLGALIGSYLGDYAGTAAGNAEGARQNSVAEQLAQQEGEQAAAAAQQESPNGNVQPNITPAMQAAAAAEGGVGPDSAPAVDNSYASFIAARNAQEAAAAQASQEAAAAQAQAQSENGSTGSSSSGVQSSNGMTGTDNNPGKSSDDSPSGGSGSSDKNGGLMIGKGTGTSDSIPVHVSNGEYIINAASAKILGRSKLDYLNSLGKK